MQVVDSLRSWRRQPLSPRSRARNIEAIGGGLLTFAIAGYEAKRRRVAVPEETVFRGVNELPDGIHGPVWAVMQSGSLASVGVVTVVAAAARRPVTAVGLGVAGVATWGGAKLIKHRVGRGRPAAHIDDVNVRGKEQTGLGFPSGHAAVAVSLAAVASPALPPPAVAAVWSAAALTAGARMYVGAHLPLDIVGGIGLGAAAGGFTNLLLGDR